MVKYKCCCTKKEESGKETEKIKTALPALSCFGTDPLDRFQLYEATIINTLLKSLCHVETSRATFHCHTPTHTYSIQWGKGQHKQDSLQYKQSAQTHRSKRTNRWARVLSFIILNSSHSSSLEWQTGNKQIKQHWSVYIQIRMIKVRDCLTSSKKPHFLKS